jgi:hypothetical protein
LLHEWDPIGVSDGGAEDEYDRYSLQVVKMLGRGPTRLPS